jgi:hypothetical protein
LSIGFDQNALDTAIDKELEYFTSRMKAEREKFLALIFQKYPLLKFLKKEEWIIEERYEDYCIDTVISLNRLEKKEAMVWMGPYMSSWVFIIQCFPFQVNI